jgi:hypothetical protein
MCGVVGWVVAIGPAGAQATNTHLSLRQQLFILQVLMKKVVLDRVEGQPRFHAKMLDFASYYGFVPRVCRPRVFQLCEMTQIKEGSRSL